VGGCGLDASGSGYVSVAGSCEHGNEHFGFRKGRGISRLAVTVSLKRRTLLHAVS
jgi:hypothetical protein